MIGAVIAIQTFGDFLNFNPHCHVLCTDGTFFGSGSFKVAPALDTEPLEKLFQHKVLKMLVRKGKGLVGFGVTSCIVNISGCIWPANQFPFEF
jgi:hypothetical protein